MLQDPDGLSDDIVDSSDDLTKNKKRKRPTRPDLDECFDHSDPDNGHDKSPEVNHGGKKNSTGKHTDDYGRKRQAQSADKNHYPARKTTPIDFEDEGTYTTKSASRSRTSTPQLDKNSGKNHGAQDADLPYQQVAIGTMVNALTRLAVNDINPPANSGRTPFMYWAASPTEDCLLRLIKHYENTNKLKPYVTEEFITKWASTVRSVANAEKNTQTLRLRQLFLSNSKPAFQIAGFILEEDAVWNQEPVVAGRLTDCIDSIEDLRTLLSSCEMYTNQPLHDLWCEALESGYFRGAPQKDPQSIDNTISIAMEAHFRLELWYALSRRNFRHSMNPAKKEQVAENYKKKCTGMCGKTVKITLQMRGKHDVLDW